MCLHWGLKLINFRTDHFFYIKFFIENRLLIIFPKRLSAESSRILKQMNKIEQIETNFIITIKILILILFHILHITGYNLWPQLLKGEFRTSSLFFNLSI